MSRFKITADQEQLDFAQHELKQLRESNQNFKNLSEEQKEDLKTLRLAKDQNQATIKILEEKLANSLHPDSPEMNQLIKNRLELAGKAVIKNIFSPD